MLNNLDSTSLKIYPFFSLTDITPSLIYWQKMQDMLA
jgi:hypothetical protein